MRRKKDGRRYSHILSQSSHALLSSTATPTIPLSPKGEKGEGAANAGVAEGQVMFSFIEEEPVVDVYDRESQELLSSNLPLTGTFAIFLC